MKKILFILFSLYSFSFALSVGYYQDMSQIQAYIDSNNLVNDVTTNISDSAPGNYCGGPYFVNNASTYLDYRHYTSCTFYSYSSTSFYTYVEYHFIPAPVCTDTVPDGYIVYPKANPDSCMAWDDLNSTEQAKYDPDTAISGAVNICNNCYAKQADLCQALSDVTVSLTQLHCSGSSTVYTNNKATKGTLQFQECDNKCYVLEPFNIPCSTVIPYLKSQCDTDVNQLHLTCDDSNAYYTSYDYQCTPDNNNTNPCQDAYNQLSLTCTDGTIQGSCKDNGMVITSNTLNCVPPDPDSGNPCDDAYSSMVTQCNVNNQSVMGSCQSRDGQIISNTLQCSPLPPDNNNSNGNIDLTETNNILRNIRSEITVSNNNLNDITNNTNNINNKISNTNNKLSKVNNNLDLINNKITTTNNNLNDIKNINKSSRDSLNGIKNGVNGINDKLDAFKNKTYDDPNTAAESKIMTFLNDSKTGIDDIKNDFNNLNDLISNGFTVPTFSAGVSPTFTTTVFNKSFTLDLCPSFSVFRPILYYIFLLIFSYLSLVIFYKGFKILSS